MKRIAGLVVAFAGSALVYALDEFGADRRVLAQTDVMPMTPVPAPAPAPGLTSASTHGQEVRAAQHALIIAQARLDLVMARQDLRSGALDSAARRANEALGALESLPESAELDSFVLQAEGILARAARGGARPVTQPAPAGVPAPAEPGPIVVQSPTQRLADLNRASRLRQHDLSVDIAESELRQEVEADALRVAPPGDVTYPADWPDKTARRAAYAGGQITRGPDYLDAKGRTAYAALYDIHDLTYEAPDFNTAIGADPALDLSNALDRQALRQYSYIFNGTPEDLAAGLPLLNGLGGVDPYFIRGPKYSALRQHQITQMVRAMLEQPAGPQVMSLPDPASGPIQP